jgi:hypothetical protein
MLNTVSDGFKAKPSRKKDHTSWRDMRNSIVHEFGAFDLTAMLPL